VTQNISSIPNFTVKFMVNISTKCLLWVSVSPKIRVESPLFKLILIIYPNSPVSKEGKIHELSFYNIILARSTEIKQDLARFSQIDIFFNFLDLIQDKAILLDLARSCLMLLDLP
jgi:hypothetical protein